MMGERAILEALSFVSIWAMQRLVLQAPRGLVEAAWVGIVGFVVAAATTAALLWDGPAADRRAGGELGDPALQAWRGRAVAMSGRRGPGRERGRYHRVSPRILSPL
jgi:hypothetical protein